MSEFVARRSAANPRDLDVSGTLPNGHPFTLTVSPWSGSRCTDVPHIKAWFDVDTHPDLPKGASDAEIEAAVDKATEIGHALDARLGPLAETVVERSGVDEAAVRRVVRLGLGLAFGRDVPAAAIEAAIEADASDFARRREDHLRPIVQAVWEEAQEYEMGLRF